jgi:predicted exporter
MFFSGFKGFAELGAIAALGMFLSYGLMVSLLPALLVLLSRSQEASERGRDRIGRLLAAGQNGWLAPVLLLALAALCLVGPAGFDRNYLNLQPRDSDTVRLERLMVESSDYAPNFAVFIRPDQAAASALAEELREEATVAQVRTLADLDLFYEDREPPPPPPHFRALFEDERGRQAVYVYPSGDIWDQDENREFLAAMRAVDEHVTGMPLLGEFIIELSRNAMVKATALGLGFVVLVLAIDFREPRRVLLAMVVPLLSLAATAALMKVLGLAFNPLNVMTIPLILGIAVDDAVHIIHRCDQAGGDIGSSLAGAGRGVVLTSLTNLAAFGAVVFSSHRGLRSFSLTLCIGVTLALLISVLVLPWLMRRFKLGG